MVPFLHQDDQVEELVVGVRDGFQFGEHGVLQALAVSFRAAFLVYNLVEFGKVLVTRGYLLSGRLDRAGPFSLGLLSRFETSLSIHFVLSRPLWP